MVAERKPPRWTYLIAEVDAAAALLGRGRAIWLDYSFALRDAEPLMVLLATGCEKLLKLTYGELHQALHGSWPPASTLGANRNGYGHDLRRLDEDLRHLIRQHLARATNPGVVSAALERLEADLYIGQLIDTLTSYGMNGRFHNLDHLASRPNPPKSPGALWEQLVTDATFAHADHRMIAQTSDRGLQHVREGINQLLINSLVSWQEFYARAWIQGVCGEQARGHGFSLLPATQKAPRRRSAAFDLLPSWPSLPDSTER